MKSMLTLESHVKNLPGIGSTRAGLLARLGIVSIADLLFFFPRRWEDRSNWQRVESLRPGSLATVQGRITAWEERRSRRGLTITRYTLQDETGSIGLVFFNQPFLKSRLRRGEQVIASGKVELRFGQLQLTNPEWEIYRGDDEVLHSGRIVPIYPGTEGLSSRLLRRAVYTALEMCGHQIPEVLPAAVRVRYRFLPRPVAVREMHFPTDWRQVREARRCLAFEELFLLQLGLLQGRKRQESGGISHSPDGKLVASFFSNLPFSLTRAQRRALSEIARDMESSRPMNRLLQGDVGSGKTVVAAYALVKTIENGYQGVLMAPTEILAEQHYLNLRRLLAPLGLKIYLLTGSVTGKERETVCQQIRSGEAQLVIGTHAVIQEEVEFANLGLAVIDEQHRFGVDQRAHLVHKGKSCDLLVMTATPIPRTLALVFYSQLDVTVLDELPPGRKPVKTYWVSETARPRVYHFLRQEIKKGRQAYLVCPLVEESDKLQVQAATELADTLQKEVFPDLKVGLIHGRLPVAEKEQIMEAFRAGEIDILVATTVIEVGVDVPNASVIVIENAERFGLAQLHQLRGRVGRGEHPSYCILIGSPTTREGRERLRVIAQTTDGFRLAEADLKLRGPGEFFGTRQSGLPDLKVADLVEDLALLVQACQEAQTLLDQDPDLADSAHVPLRLELERVYGPYWRQRQA